jgi:hypothetical protein
MKWLLRSLFVQWLVLNVLKMPWVAIRKDDLRFKAGNKISYEGDGSVAPTKPTTDRNTWKTWIVVRLDTLSNPAHVAVDDCFGNRLACLGVYIMPGRLVALRVGHEGAEAFFIGRSTERAPKAELIARCQEEDLPHDAVRL